MKKIRTISSAVPALCVWMIAETCLEKAGIQPTNEKVNWLVTFANFQFHTNIQFRKGVLRKTNGGNAGRDYLYAFMNHWVKGKMWENNPLRDDMLKFQEEIPEYKS